MLCLYLASGVPAWGASIAGQIQVRHRLTKKRVTPLSAAYDRGVSIAPEADDRDFPALEMSRIAVYIESLNLPAASPAHAVLEQRGQRFPADVLVVPAGSTVSFPNRDPIFHNVFSLSRAKSFDLGNYRQNETRTVTFSRPGIVHVYCHLHPNMSAAIVVTPSSWGVKPDASGRYVLRDLPDGKHRVTVWHRSAGFFRKEIQVRGEETAELDFVIPIDTGSPYQP